MRIAAIDQLWYSHNRFMIFRWLLLPFSCVYQIITTVRRKILTQFFQRQYSVPVIVVGNITVGGVGKTPLVIALAHRFRQQGLHVGIVSRGYGASISTFPFDVKVDSEPTLVGDEPLLMAQRTGFPVVISPKRTQAIDYVLAHYPCDVIISDDGLQHYAMGRSIEIVVVDGIRQFGNGYCLPAGPLRESVQRLKEVDLVVINAAHQNTSNYPENTYPMQLTPHRLRSVLDDTIAPELDFAQSIAAVAGIGHPERFFLTLSAIGLTFKPYPYPDHHVFVPKDLKFSEEMVVMTEKDAVKCRAFAQKNWFYLPVDAELPDDFWAALFGHSTLKRLFDS